MLKAHVPCLWMKPPVSTVVFVALLLALQSLPTLHRESWLTFRRDDDWGKCGGELCSQPANCLSGTVRSMWLLLRMWKWGRSVLSFGQKRVIAMVSVGTTCHASRMLMDGEIPEPGNIDVNLESVYGPEGKTYEDVCQLKDLSSQKSASISKEHKNCENQVIQNPHTSQRNF